MRLCELPNVLAVPARFAVKKHRAKRNVRRVGPGAAVSGENGASGPAYLWMTRRFVCALVFTPAFGDMWTNSVPAGYTLAESTYKPLDSLLLLRATIGIT